MRDKSLLIENISIIQSVINQLDDIGYKDFLYTIKSDYNRLKFVYDILLKHGLYKQRVTADFVLAELAPQKKFEQEELD